MNQPVRSWIHDPQWWQRTPFQDRLAQWRVYLHPTWAPLNIHVTLVYNCCNYLSLKLLILLLTKQFFFFFLVGGASFNRHWTWNTNQENTVHPALWRVILYFEKLSQMANPTQGTWITSLPSESSCCAVMLKTTLLQMKKHLVLHYVLCSQASTITCCSQYYFIVN